MAKNNHKKNDGVKIIEVIDPEKEYIEKLNQCNSNTKEEEQGLTDDDIPDEEIMEHMTAMERDDRNMTVRAYVNEYQLGRVHKDLAIQRGDVWSKFQRSKLIHSIMLNFIVPEMVSWNRNMMGEINLLDGRQRTTSIIMCVQDEFRFDEKTPDAYNIKIAGKLFSELPLWLQNKVLNYKLRFQIVNDQDPLMIADLFVRLNSGTALKTFQRVRAELGTEMMGYINEQCELPFFRDIVHYTESQIKNMQYQKLIFAVMMVLDGEYNLTDNNIGEYAKYMRDNKNSARVKLIHDRFIERAEYLGKIQLQEKFRKNIFIITHIPMIFDIVNTKVDPVRFSENLIEWFPDRGEVYRKASSSGVGQSYNVQTRLREIKEYFTKFNYPNSDDDTEEEIEAEVIQFEDAKNTIEETKQEDEAKKAQEILTKIFANEENQKIIVEN